ncbi:histone-lysine N-methyltransferase [Fragilaria crotonensis]|nr:histone-lysine N-methyltransferase [Fragilaria crotonensis]
MTEKMEKGNPLAEKVGFIAKALSHGFSITALQCPEAGVYVAATKDLKKGTKVMECVAASIALDPTYRRSHCGFCAKQYPNPRLCDKCRVVGSCPQCSSDNKHENECTALQALGTNFPEHDDTGEPNIDSSHLLTVRLLCQREHLDWELAKRLHCVTLPHEIDPDIIAICSKLHQHGSEIMSWVGNDVYKLALARVIGCSHAITDVSLPLGSQAIGRGLFPEHSFYNHSCIPNSFLSCDLMTEGKSEVHTPNVSARLHLLADIKAGDQITISYVPTSGLGFQERQHRLLQGYGFVCSCDACKSQEILLQPNTDVDSIREIQFSCNERMLKMQDSNVDDEEIAQIISLVEMTKRGIRNQAIPQSHEVSIESERLLAMAYTLLDRKRRQSFIIAISLHKRN